MAVEWRIKGTELANCNCAYGCPCQFNALPTHGNCRAAVAFEIEEGHFATMRTASLVASLAAGGLILAGAGLVQRLVHDPELASVLRWLAPSGSR